MLSYLESIPDKILSRILDQHPNCELRYSMTAGSDYWMSTCPCGGYYGDHYVHREALDLTPRSPEKLKINVIFDEGELSLNSGFSSSDSLGYLLVKTSSSLR